MWKNIWESIANLFDTILLSPLNGVAKLELENWWLANSVSWIFIVIGLVAFIYWMGQLKKFNDNNEEDKSISSHSYL